LIYKCEGDSIEARVAEGEARKLSLAPPTVDPAIGMKLWNHVLTDSVKIVISTPLRRSDPSTDSTSHRGRKDGLAAYRIDLSTGKPLRKHVKPGSSKHRIQSFTTKKYAYATIVTEFAPHT